MRLVLGAAIFGAAYIILTTMEQAAQEVAAATGEDYGLTDVLADKMDEVTGYIGSQELSDMQPSDQIKRDIKGSEGLKLQPYKLNDGGYTVGYGHWSASPLSAITQVQAEAMFDDDLENRAAKWVRLYVTVPVNQAQFDALVHIAYNMSPRSFKKFADAVNAGQGIRDIAAESIGWVATEYKNGIRNRRNREINLFENGVYA
ncbi:lysozyme [Undibacterium sp. Ji42W]|uniref:lysozyme n=1 Tax=Undibacterium sp. Ji42W TaxID=3413039 RepID=UPI003BF1708B